MKDEQTLDLNNKQLNETIYRLYGFWIKQFLKHVMGQTMFDLPKIKGTPLQINSFANTISKEKKYVEAIKEYGLDDKKTYAQKSKLEKAAKDFFKKTGIKWPFK
tara:strand:- start:110 stop:421 length:312 start_codon:yes stop_codon:yes gene_type:complete